ncbi:MAG: DUF1501 domain-containing protein [Pirellulaceae bacterium]
MPRKPPPLPTHAATSAFPLSRRALLTLGAAPALGMLLPDLLRAREAGPPADKSFGAAKSVIFLFLHGGHPQHETFDPKPQAPAEVRGEFGTVATSVPGVHFSDRLPAVAKIADRLSIVRSMSHDNTNHVQACLPAMTGHKHPPEVRKRGDFPPTPNDFPHFGAVVDHLRGGAGERSGGDLPSWVRIGPEMTRSNGTVLHGQSPGFLGRAHSPLPIDQNLTGDDVEIEAVAPQIAVDRIRQRRGLLQTIDRQRSDLARRSPRGAFLQKAYDLLTSTSARDAFDLAAEPDAVRRRYPANQVGQACLLARRLVEAGVPFVNVHWCKTPRGSWDTHGNNFKSMKESLGPTLDESLSALVLDLEERGRLDDVLVVVMAEFGRTPKINSNAGRDHWPFVYSLALAGAGLAPGVVYGASDALGAWPQSQPIDPAHMAATIYHLLGVPADTTLHDPANRPHRLILGRRIAPILA